MASKPPNILPFQTKAERDEEDHERAGENYHKAVLNSLAITRKEVLDAKKAGSPFSCAAIVIVGPAQTRADPGNLGLRFSLCCAGHAVYLLGALREAESYIIDMIRHDREAELDDADP